MGQLQRWVTSPLRLNCSETISHRERSEVGNETLDFGQQEIFMLFCHNLITFDSAAHLKWTNPTENMELTHLWNETLVLLVPINFRLSTRIQLQKLKTKCRVLLTFLSDVNCRRLWQMWQIPDRGKCNGFQ